MKVIQYIHLMIRKDTGWTRKRLSNQFYHLTKEITNPETIILYLTPWFIFDFQH